MEIKSPPKKNSAIVYSCRNPLTSVLSHLPVDLIFQTSPIYPPDFGVMRVQWSAALRNSAVTVSAEWKYDKSEVEGRWASLVSKLRLSTADSTWSTSPQTAVSPTPSVYLPLSFLSFNLCISVFLLSPLSMPSHPLVYRHILFYFIFIQMHRHTHMPDSQPPEPFVVG